MDIEKIRSVHSTLHLIFHRNKNQHGKAKWWKWLSMLKRTSLTIAKLLEDEPSNSRVKPSADMYIQHLAMHIVPRCYLVFSTVVADTQFSALGTVLLSALSCLAKATGIDRHMMRDYRPLPPPKGESTKHNQSNTRPSRKEDTGELVCRTGDSTDRVYIAKRTSESVARLAPKTADDTKMKVRKGKEPKKKKNAIDDLFDGLY